MLRHLTRYFRVTMALQPVTAAAKVKPHSSRLLQCAQLHVEQPIAKLSVAVSQDTERVALETDPEYISTYPREKEKLMCTEALIETLRARFRLSSADIEVIRKNNYIGRKYIESELSNTLDTLCLHGLTKRSLVDHPWLITMDKTHLDAKIALLNRLNGRDLNHFVPFLRLTMPRLRKLVGAMNQEAKTVPCGNRMYYISEKLDTDPYVVAKYLAKRLFILEMPYVMFEQNLQLMLRYKISAANILKDLWAFRYTPKAVELRLERAKRAKKDKIMPWMVRCPEPILQRSLKLSLDELKVLGDKSTVLEYVAERLQFSVEDTRMIMNKHPQVHTVRVTKIKEVLDYLLEEAGFTRYEIAQVPRILCHSLETTQKRLEELKSFGCRPSSLVILCRSKREYEKFVKAWCGKQKITKPAEESHNSEGTELPVDPGTEISDDTVKAKKSANT